MTQQEIREAMAKGAHEAARRLSPELAAWEALSVPEQNLYLAQIDGAVSAANKLGWRFDQVAAARSAS